MNRLILLFTLGVGVVAVSFGAIFARLAGSVPALSIATWRLAVASVFLLPVSMVHGSLRKMTRNEVLWSMGSGLALALHFGLWITSLKHTSVASSTLFVSTHPIFVALGSVVLLRERLSARTAWGIAVTLAGGILIGAGDFRLGGEALYGDLLAWGGGLMAGVYFLIGRRVRRNVAWLDYAALAYGTAAVAVLLVTVLWEEPLVGFRPPTYVYLALLGLVPQLLGHSSFNWALRHLSAPRVSVIVLGEPVGATILAYLFFGETLDWLKGVGAAIILLGIYISLHSEEVALESNDRPREDRLG